MSKTKKRLIVDMDGVLADVYQQFIRFEENESGKKINLSEVSGIDEIVAFPNGRKHVHQNGFFRTAPVIPHAVETLRELQKNMSYLLFPQRWSSLIVFGRSMIGWQSTFHLFLGNTLCCAAIRP